MITLLDINFWIGFISFFIAVFFAFFVPGDVVLANLKISRFQRFTMATIIGMVMWAWQGFTFGYLHVRFFSYLYLISFFGIWLYSKRTYLRPVKKIKFTFRISSIDWLVVLVVIFGLLVQLAPVWGFGLKFDKGIFLCCGNREDFLLHLSFVSAIVKNIPPIHPGMNDVLIHNYHYWSNLVVAEIVRVFHLPLLNTQFQYMTFFTSFFLGLTTVCFALVINISRNFVRWLIFFIYFGGDAIILFLLLLGKGWKEFTLVSSLEDGSTFLVNPPRAFSLVIALVGLSLFFIWRRDKKNWAGILSVFIFASTIGFKVYTGFFALMGFSVVILYLLYKKQTKDLIVLGLVYPISAIIYFSANAKAGGLFWVPLHIAKDFIVQPAFGLSRWELARQIFLEHKNYVRILQYELMYTVIFFITLCGTKILAFFQSFFSLLRLGKELTIFLLAGMFGSLFIGLFFFQHTGGSNTFNFIVSFWFFLSIPTALAIVYWQSKIKSNKWKVFFISIIIFLTLPRIVLNTYLNINEYSKLGYLFIKNDQLEAFSFVQKHTNIDSLFIVDPANGLDARTPYVGVFIDRPMFVSGEEQLKNHGISTKKRTKIRDFVFRSSNPNAVAGALLANKINYIFLFENNNLIATESSYFTKQVFRNSDMKILKVDDDAIKRFLQKDKKI